MCRGIGGEATGVDCDEGGGGDSEGGFNDAPPQRPMHGSVQR
jgi:hypothetical protein